MVSGLHFYRFNGRVIVRPKLAHNVLQLGEVADFEAFTFILALHPPLCQTDVMRSTFIYS